VKIVPLHKHIYFYISKG